MSDRACPCGKPIRSDNRTGWCDRCQGNGKGGGVCSCGCGRPVSRRSRSGLARACWLRAAAARLAPAPA